MHVHSICNFNSFVNLQLGFIICLKVRYIETNLNQENIKLL